MPQIFEMKLRSDPFRRICSGEKTIEYRLQDEKRSLLNKGDYIRFTEIATEIKNFYCMDCLADYLECTVDELLEKIEEFKAEGCKLFM